MKFAKWSVIASMLLSEVAAAQPRTQPTATPADALVSPTALADTKPLTATTPTSSDNLTVDAVLKYAEFLRNESKEHREFLESFYSKAAGVFSAIVAAFAALLAFFNWKSKKDVQDAVNSRFEATVATLVDSRIKAMDVLIEENRRRFEGDKEQINKILVELSSKTSGYPTFRSSPIGATARGIKKQLLWVDDHPGNNDYPREIFEKMGIKTKLARSTEEALAVITRGRVDLIISDMGRGRDATAGLTLLQELNQINFTSPVIIYASPGAVEDHGNSATRLGAALVTSSVTEILSGVPRILFPESTNAE